MKVTLAQALLRRKELASKVSILSQFKTPQLFETKSQRVKAHEGLDDLVAQVPKLTASQVTAEYDWHARQLRLVDAAIQHTNWTTEIEVGDSIMSDYVQPIQETTK